MSERIRIRMYDVGFGDGFLLEFPVDNGEQFRVLVDCGAHSSGYPHAGWKPEMVVDQIISDVASGGGGAGGSRPRIDVVVATHRHQDHVSGFRDAAWSEVDVGEVWMPWTEDPSDREATRVRNRQSRLALGLYSKLQMQGASGDNAVMNLVGNALTNETAMHTLHKGFAGRPRRRFLSSSTDLTICPDSCPGLKVHVIGPSRNEDVIRDMDPPSGASYLRLATAGTRSSPQLPFGRQFTFDEDSLPSAWAQLALTGGHGEDIKRAARAVLSDDDFSVAVSLEKAVNGTSLMLMFEYGDAFLLFPGDAQWGAWRAALDDDAHRELLLRTTFLKVGHHGSHNATPPELLESLKARPMWGSAVSVHPVGQWPEIPKVELMTALGAASERVRRSDEPGSSADGVEVRPGICIDFLVPFA